MNLFITLITILILLIILLAAALVLDLYMGWKVMRPRIRHSVPKTGSNHFHYFTNGHQLFQDMRQSIERAQSSIHLSFFIFHADEVGNEWLELLKKKAHEGVEVRLLVDTLASFALRKKRSELKAAGVSLAFSAKPTFPYTVYFLNQRNHRKMTIIDGTIGYFGGFNVSRDYIGRKPEMGPWHDNHLKVIGESVADLQHFFLEDWKKATHEDLVHEPVYFPKSETGPGELTLLATDGKQLDERFAEELARAQSSIIIGSPYFVPSSRLMQVLQDRLNHGIKLTILLPLKKDHGLVQPASYHYLEPLVKKGAKLFHFYQGFYHSKLFIIDRKRCYLGTANFDQRSLFWNGELSGFTEDQTVIRQVFDQLAKEIHLKSIPISYDQIKKRSPIEKIKTICSVWLSYFL
ncbi:phospholipase D-like domain-containing protein [Sporolactobacillus inulinus]|uniref:Phospholipase n=1 Tax=Sporolactobacillus inulinus CASD TaxID=1069536 RepID=A0A0U1QNI5_9BACL|nr:phospholipase D-like domain-containing protein [Sporolactobacillus inulinus]KLI02369.1 phospholipase [Sporolactobacillus inulinus CASD]GEB78468.1 cardiolipin synthase [Sporolactobacillus inulinus]